MSKNDYQYDFTRDFYSHDIRFNTDETDYVSSFRIRQPLSNSEIIQFRNNLDAEDFFLN